MQSMINNKNYFFNGLKKIYFYLYIFIKILFILKSHTKNGQLKSIYAY